MQYRDRGSVVHAGGKGPAPRDRYRGAVRSARNIERQSARRAALRLPSRRGPAAGLRDRITAKRGRGSMTTPGTKMIREDRTARELFEEVMANPARKKFRSEEHTSELQSLMRISYAVFCLKKKTR